MRRLFTLKLRGIICGLILNIMKRKTNKQSTAKTFLPPQFSNSQKKTWREKYHPQTLLWDLITSFLYTKTKTSEKQKESEYVLIQKRHVNEKSPHYICIFLLSKTNFQCVKFSN